MSLYLRQQFTMGRFHATRWGENPAADAYGEWPPSPWRLLRALASAWFDAGHQKGISAETVRSVLSKIAAAPPKFWLPPTARREGPIKHYHPKAKHSPEILGVSDSTLVEDHFVCIPSTESVWWIWEGVDLESAEALALQELCASLRYFGRAESVCTIQPTRSERLEPNSSWKHHRFADCRPVLCASPELFQPEYLLEQTGDMLKKRRARLPLGAEYMFYSLPAKPPRPARPWIEAWPEGLNCIQFVLGGQVWPTSKFIASIAERFRGHALKSYAEFRTQDRNARFDPAHLSATEWSVNLSGKSYGAHPKRLEGHQHAYYLPQLDDRGLVTRVVVWSQTAFQRDEIRALCNVERIYWGSGTYPLRAVWIPFDSPIPEFLGAGESRRWRAYTPFVPPRFVVGRNGKARRGQSPIDQIRDLLVANGLPGRTAEVRLDSDAQHPVWVGVHRVRSTEEPSKRREVQLGEIRVPEMSISPATRRAFANVEICFAEPVRGPILLGHSAHFGLGQFHPVPD